MGRDSYVRPLFVLIALTSFLLPCLYHLAVTVGRHRTKVVREDKLTIVDLKYQDINHNSPIEIERNPKVEIKSEPKKGYVAAMRYSGQQGAGIKALKSLQCWASTVDVPMYIMEPTIVGGILKFGVKPNISASHILLSELFDTEHYNKVSSERHLAKLLKRNEFLASAPRKVVYVHMNGIGANNTPTVLWEGECLQFNDSQKVWRVDVKELVSRNSYCIVKVVEAYFSFGGPSALFSHKEARDVVYGKWSPTQVTTVFSLWRQGWYTTEPVPNCGNLNFTASPRTISHAQEFEEQYLSGQNSVAVMFRLERMIERLHASSEKILDIGKCLQQVIETTQSELRKRQRSSAKPFVTLDIGKSGSSSWESTLSRFGLNMTVISKQLSDTLNVLYHGEWNLTEWEEDFQKSDGFIDDRAYIAGLQRTIASRADCIILVGGGHFQNLALDDYFQYHPDREKHCIHRVCSL